MNFDKYRTYCCVKAKTPNAANEQTDAFLTGFVGFWEGDGHVSFFLRNGKPVASMGLTQSDPRLLCWVQSQLGFGRVYKHGRSWRYSVDSRAGLECLLWLFFDNLILAHRRAQWIYLFQLFYPSGGKGCSDQLIPDPTIFSPSGFWSNVSGQGFTLRDGWLAGFTEAEGGFEGNSTRGLRLCGPNGPVKLRNRCGIRLQYRLTQKTGKREMLEYVSSLLGQEKAAIYVDKRQRGDKIFFCDRLAIAAGQPQDQLVQYFTAFPLQGLKRFDFTRFRLLRARRRSRGSAFRTPELASRTAHFLNAYATSRKARDYDSW